MAPIRVPLLNCVLPVKVILLTSGNGKVGTGSTVCLRMRAQDRHTGRITLTPNSRNSHPILTSREFIAAVLSLAPALYPRYYCPLWTFFIGNSHCNTPRVLGHAVFAQL